MSLLERTPDVPTDAAFGLIAEYKADSSDKKVDLCPGFYRDENAKPWVLPSVTKAKSILQEDKTQNHELLPQLGHPGLVSAARRLVFGDASDSRIVSIQTVSGTGANHLAARFLSDIIKPKAVWMSNPTWINYTEIWKHVNPDLQQLFYPYYDGVTCTLDFEGMISTLRKEASRGDILILQACAHNPTGVDPTRKQWEAIADVCEEKGMFPIFDLAYQGFATGNVENDAWAIRHFAARPSGAMEIAVAQSFSKNCGLYGERTGVLHVVTNDGDTGRRVEAVLRKMHRAEITSAPSFGAKVVANILQDPALHQQWLRDLETMSTRMKEMRKRLYDELTKRHTPGNWGHILTDIGMFSMTGLTQYQVAILKNTYHIYLLPNGRISVPGLIESNVEYVAEAIHQVATV